MHGSPVMPISVHLHTDCSTVITQGLQASVHHEADLERQDLSCMHPAHDELESILMMMMILT